MTLLLSEDCLRFVAAILDQPSAIPPESCRHELALLAGEGDSSEDPETLDVAAPSSAWDPYLIFLAVNAILFAPISAAVAVMPLVPQKWRKTTGVTLKNNKHALDRGYPLFLVRVMQAYQHLTICTMMLTVFYLTLTLREHYLGTHPRVLPAATSLRCAVRQALPASGLVVAQFWSFMLLPGSPWTLVDRKDFPANNKKTQFIVKRLWFSG